MTADLKPDDIAAIDPAYWALRRKIRLVGGEFSFDQFPFQKEPMQSRAQRTCYMKGTQGGFTEIEVLKTLHGLIFDHFPRGVLYLFPTADNVQDFSKSRFAPLIKDNPEAIGRHVRRQGTKGTDTAGLKRIRRAYLYLRGARLSQSIEGAGTDKESVQLRSIPADKVIFDELDLMDQDVIEKARGRMGASTIKGECYIANPTLPDFGIAAVFGKSDQRHLFRRCAACGTETCAELTFPECVKRHEDGTGYIACGKCGRPVGLDDIRWIPLQPDNTDYMHGYRWSQLSSAFSDPGETLDAFNDPPEGNLGDVYRMRLGLPYVAAENRLTAGVVKACCGDGVMPTWHKGPCAMGVDIGREFHVVIGTRTDRDRYEILKMMRVPCAAKEVTMDSAWRTVHDLAKRFNVRSAVIDILPYEHAAREFQAAEGYRIFLCRYDENRVQAVRYNDPEQIVQVNRLSGRVEHVRFSI